MIGQKALKPPAQLAAAALVLRDYADDVEILMVRRSRNLRFLGGYWVFPGGLLDEADATVPVIGDIHSENRLPASLYTTAVRELYEETGLLIANARDGSPLGNPAPAGNPPDIPDSAQLPQQQFADLLLRKNACVSTERMQPWAHWTTPSAAGKRFDTHFFVARAPLGQVAAADDTEIDLVRWTRPAEWAFGTAVADYPLSPPTQLVLRELHEELQACGSLERLLSEAAGRRIRSVLPKLVGDPGDVVMPWEPEYDSLPGEGRPWDADGIAARQRWPSRLPARIRAAHHTSPESI